MTIKIPETQADIISLIHNSYQYKPSLLKIDESLWKYAIRSVIRGENLLIQGDSGFGKTYLATVLADVFTRPFFPFNLGATQDARSYLVGNTFFDPERGTYVAESFFVKAIQTPNSVILLDEVSRAHPDAHNILMTVLDKRQRYLRIDERPDTPTIKVANGVTFIGTANVGSEYTATRVIDRAFLDRWTVILMPHLNLTQETELLREMYPTLDDVDIAAIADIAIATRSEIKKDNSNIDTVISTRATTEIAALIYDGFTLKEAAEIRIYPFYSAVGGAESSQNFMKKLVQQYIRDDSNTPKPSPFDIKNPNGQHHHPW
jgi:MoxR-like ATPase